MKENKATIKLFLLLIISISWIFPSNINYQINNSSQIKAAEPASNPRDSIKSYEWSQDTLNQFETGFSEWAEWMQQSYYPIEDTSSTKFREKSFEEVIRNSTFNGHSIQCH